MTTKRRLTALVLSLMMGLSSLSAFAEEATAQASPEEATQTAHSAAADELTPLPIDNKPGPKPNPAHYLPDEAGYEDASIKVAISHGRAFDTNTLIARVTIKDASQLRTASGLNFRSKALFPAHSLAKRNNAVIAVSGDYYIHHNTGYVVRQGDRYRLRPDGRDYLVIDSAGDFHPLFAVKDKQTVLDFEEKLKAEGKSVVNAFCFGPVLSYEGQAFTEEKDKGYFGMAPQKPTQRAAIAQLGPLDYLIVTTEGPENEGSVGFTVSQMAEYVDKVARSFVPGGAMVAYNLDGGSSSSVAMNGRKINSKDSKVRPINDIIYFATLVPQDEATDAR